MALAYEEILDSTGLVILNRFYSTTNQYIYRINDENLIWQKEFIFPNGLYTLSDFYETTSTALAPTETNILLSYGSGISSAGTAKFGTVAGRISLKKEPGIPVINVKYYDTYGVEILEEELPTKTVSTQRLVVEGVSNEHFFEVFVFWPEQIDQYPELRLEITVKYDGQDKVKLLDVPVIIESNNDPDLFDFIYSPSTMFN